MYMYTYLACMHIHATDVQASEPPCLDTFAGAFKKLYKDRRKTLTDDMLSRGPAVDAECLRVRIVKDGY